MRACGYVRRSESNFNNETKAEKKVRSFFPFLVLGRGTRCTVQGAAVGCSSAWTVKWNGVEVVWVGLIVQEALRGRSWMEDE